MRTGIVAALAAVFLQAVLFSSAVAQPSGGIRAEVISITGEARDPSRARAPRPTSDARPARPAHPPFNATNATRSAATAAITLAPAAGRIQDPWGFIVKPAANGTMGYLANDDFHYGIDNWVIMMFSDEIMHEVDAKAPPPAVKDPDPPIGMEDLFTNMSTGDIFEDFMIQSAAIQPVSPLATRAPAKPAVFVAGLAASSINSDTALFVAAIPLVKGHTDEAHAKLFRIQLTKLSNGAHFCTPADNAFVFRPRVAASNAGRLFIAFDSSYSGGTVGSVLSFDLAALMAGGPAKVKCFTGANLAGLTPPRIRDGSKLAYFVAAPQFSNLIKRFKFTTGAAPVNDKLVATPDINVTPYSSPPAAVQPNGAHLYSGGAEFRVPTVQIGNVFWNVHTIDDGMGHSKVRLYKFNAAGTTPLMTLTLGTLSDHSDDLFAPSLDVMTSPINRAYVTFARTIATDATNGKATILQARGPSSSSSNWKSVMIARSAAQFSKTWLNQPCDTFEFAGCLFMSNTGTLIDTVNSLVWSIGPLIVAGDGSGKETNWSVKGVGKPQ